jgi:hypothetical protein
MGIAVLRSVPRVWKSDGRKRECPGHHPDGMKNAFPPISLNAAAY